MEKIRAPSLKKNRVMDNLRIFGMVRSGLLLNGMVHGYCLDVVPCKNSSSLFEK